MIFSTYVWILTIYFKVELQMYGLDNILERNKKFMTLTVNSFKTYKYLDSLLLKSNVWNLNLISKFPTNQTRNKNMPPISIGLRTSEYGSLISA